ncbi:MAG TPA: hypothetical protein VJL29_04360 [Thermoguttaceae bacterium]|nr:hypothetical protein [Thermoguttaceae bacterium]
MSNGFHACPLRPSAKKSPAEKTRTKKPLVQLALRWISRSISA